MIDRGWGRGQILVMVQSVKMAILCALVMIRIGIRVATLTGTVIRQAQLSIKVQGDPGVNQ